MTKWLRIKEQSDTISVFDTICLFDIRLNIKFESTDLNNHLITRFVILEVLQGIVNGSPSHG